MKTRHQILALIAGLGAIAISGVGCSPDADDPTTTTAEEAGDAMERTAENAGDAMQNAGEATKEAVADAGEALQSTWNDIKDATFDDRSQFEATVQNLASQVDEKIDQLEANGAEASSTALQQLKEAREDLTEELDDLGDATADTWSEAKAEVASAWERVRDAFEDLRTQDSAS